MDMVNATRIAADELRVTAFGGISNVYAAIGYPLEHPGRCVILQNLTNQVLMFSLKGLTDTIPLPSYGQITFDITSNKSTDTGMYMAIGDQWFVKEIAGGTPSAGFVCLTVFYGETS